MHIEITKVELSSRIFLKYDYSEQTEKRLTKFKCSADAPVHEDLADAIEALVPHFVMLTEMKKKPQLVKAFDLQELPEELTKKFKVKGVKIDDNKGNISYTISGFKILNTGKSVHFETPKTEKGEGEDAYEFFNDLEQKIETIKEEVLEYMEGKQAQSTQKTLDFEGEDFNPDEDQDEGVRDFVPAEEVA